MWDHLKGPIILPPCAIHTMVDQRCRTAKDQRRVQRRMLGNRIEAHAYPELTYAWSVQKCGACNQRPLFEWPSIVHLYTIIGCSYLDLWRQPRKMRLVQVLDTRIEQHAYADFSCASNVHICIVRRDHPSFKRPSFAFEWCWAQARDTDHDEMEQRSEDLDQDMHRSCMHFHFLPSARVIPV